MGSWAWLNKLYLRPLNSKFCSWAIWFLRFSINNKIELMSQVKHEPSSSQS